MSATWAILLAGGVGTRLWPASTPDRPKQVHPFGDGPSLVHDACRRLQERFPVDRILVMTGRRMHAAVRQALPQLPDTAFLVEPEGRNTLPCLLWATAEVQRRGGTALVSVHADHAIDDPAPFLAALERATQAADRGHIALIGLQPEWASTELGWICPGPTLPDLPGTHAVERFVEKPERSVAEALLAQGALWNLGLFAWSVGRFEGEAERIGLGGPYAELCSGTPIEAVWPTLPRISIDHGLLQSSPYLAVVPGRFAWSDLGTWRAVRDRTASPNVHVQVDSTNLIVDAPGASVITIGVHNLVIAVRDGRILVSATDRVSEVGAAVADLNALTAARETD